ncbi:MAG: hypothetical protein OEM66_00755 [Acidimicrobiia bacterium]|nr:hypothetical protein [Acidimicrobiia bacterium]
MSSTLSIRVWGWYIAAAGFTFLLAPDVGFTLLGIDSEPDAWVRMVGALAVPLAIYYLQAARYELKPFYVATILGRAAFAAFALIIGFGFGPWQIALFGFLDIGGAGWTYAALRSET